MLAITLLSLLGAVNAYTEVSSKLAFYKNVDPIVYPGSYSKSHLHGFYGSDAITASTTTSDQLRAGCTTAENPNDLSTYWIPALLYTGGSKAVPLVPGSFAVYYENVDDAEIPFPDNLRLVAGRANATNQQQTPSGARVSWYCEGGPSEAKDSAAFPRATCSTHLQHLLYFPDCVNPNDLSSYAYSGTQNWVGSFKPVNRCPANMKRIVRVRFSHRYDLRSVIKNGWNGDPPLKLTSGSSYTAHGDFANGWDTQSAKNMLNAKGRDFAAIDGGRGRGNAGRPNCQPSDKEPNKGTSDYETSVRLMNGGSKRDVEAVEFIA